MLNRRHLRVKVMQALYAFLQSDRKDQLAGEKELMLSIQKTWDLYLNLLLLLLEVSDFAEKQLSDAKLKLLPTAEDLNPNRRFIDNRVFRQIRNTEEVMKLPANRRIHWPDDTIVRRLYNTLKESSRYREYMTDSESSYGADQRLVIFMINGVIAPSESVFQFFEEQSIFWVDDFEFACAQVIKVIQDLTGEEEALPHQDWFVLDKEEKDFVKSLYNKTIGGNERFSSLIADKTRNWDADRIAMMDMLLMKMALCEFVDFPTIPVKVTLNEYIDISKYYSTPKSKVFVNGVLDKILAELRTAQEIKKTGRGLVE
ncbi:MAG: transcription antitermination protein NusB [Flavobacteriales bacterium]|nr:transcription antitermination protein NusB [Flavobacteriales bacterium]MCB9447673.1 transcription antitermination protein NusB [Flavobacteriales bacterium]